MSLSNYKIATRWIQADESTALTEPSLEGFQKGGQIGMGLLIFGLERHFGILYMGCNLKLANKEHFKTIFF